MEKYLFVIIQNQTIFIYVIFSCHSVNIKHICFTVVTAREEGQEYVEVVIGVLTAITLLLLLVFIIILLLSRRQKLQSSPTVLKNPFGFAINMKVCSNYRFLHVKKSGNIISSISYSKYYYESFPWIVGVSQEFHVLLLRTFIIFSWPVNCLYLLQAWVFHISH